MPLTNKIRKLIRSLEQKKYRKQTGLFVVEGQKSINDLLESDFAIHEIFIGTGLIDKVSIPPHIPVTVVEDSEFERISLQKTPQKILALVEQKNWQIDILQIARSDIVLVLDNIQDPGNMGTILRTADWFGIRAILASNGTVDIYNPKVVQASMGAIFRIPVIYEDIVQTLGNAGELPVYGTFMQGDNIYTTSLENRGFIVMGNEANGIGKNTEKLITQRLTIPSFNPGKHPESLNVGMATAIVLSEFRRRKLSL